MKNPAFLAVVGPTASGKSALALALAEELGGCAIVSCDSMQIYRGMDIGTAKPTAEEMRRVPHRMIDLVSPEENYSVENYREDAARAIAELTGEGLLPILVGGTGLYLDALLRKSRGEIPESDPVYRKNAEALGADALWERLCRIDPAAAEKTHKNNLRRVIRALEIYDKTGRTKSELDAESRVAPDSGNLLFVLDFHNRENLYRRCDERVDEMFRAGLWQEAEGLYRSGVLKRDSTAAQAIGYKEILAAAENSEGDGWASEQIKLATRHYAKRQQTWFRREEGAHTLYVDREDGSLRPKEELLSEVERAMLGSAAFADRIPERIQQRIHT